MNNGRLDRVSEWPLLCGLTLAELKQARLEVQEQQKQFFAVRGTDDDDGVFTSLNDALTRLSGTEAEMQEFASRGGAERWVAKLRDSDEEDVVFYGIRGTKDDGVVTEMAAVFARLNGPDAEYESFDTRAEAEEWIKDVQFFAVKFVDGRAQVVSMQNIMQVTRGGNEEFRWWDQYRKRARKRRYENGRGREVRRGMMTLHVGARR